MTDRRIVVVDVETTGLDPERHTCVEVAWWDLTTGHRGFFVPCHNVSETLAGADIEALRLTRYVDRLADAPQDLNGTGVWELAEHLDGQTMAGSNPRFDCGFLDWVFRDAVQHRLLMAPPTPHHRLWDLAPYAAGVLGLPYLPGLAEVCDRLDTEHRPDHTAEGDVTATGECFLELFERAGVSLPGVDTDQDRGAES